MGILDPKEGEEVHRNDRSDSRLSTQRWEDELSVTPHFLRWANIHQFHSHSAGKATGKQVLLHIAVGGYRMAYFMADCMHLPFNQGVPLLQKGSD